MDGPTKILKEQASAERAITGWNGRKRITNALL
jgi:hypothetical protein